MSSTGAMREQQDRALRARLLEAPLPTTLEQQLGVLDEIARTGWIFLLKSDGLRNDEDRFTVMLRRGTDQATDFRRDGSKLSAMLTEAIDFFRCAGTSQS